MNTAWYWLKYKVNGKSVVLVGQHPVTREEMEQIMDENQTVEVVGGEGDGSDAELIEAHWGYETLDELNADLDEDAEEWGIYDDAT
ncbi:MAG: hypothetical protein IJI45_18450 [Anaerolineaceae bacterium]|nr:hypothetical protein [Anaerolineaceae bacterium]